ncbi:MAG: L-threonylcarbamoyladenylate synthase [Bacteroidales bacterium]|nr:L-threonylcarbamoyladenylate synthase [Bacteroidales bacterium]
MLIKIYPQNPQPRAIEQVVNILDRGGIVVYPTDTLYGLGCAIDRLQAAEAVEAIKEEDVAKNLFSFICADLSQLSLYCKPIPNAIFKLMKHHLPGPFTFILEASNQVPKLFKSKKKTVGIRVPDNNIIREIVKELGRPILNTSLPQNEEYPEYICDPEWIHEHYGHLIDLVVDGGTGSMEPSTVVDCTSGVPIIIRQGLGKLMIDD